MKQKITTSAAARKWLCASTFVFFTLGSPAAFAEERSYDVKGFDAVSASAGVDVVIGVGGGYSVRAESSVEGLERLRIEVIGDELRIKRKSQAFNWKRAPDVFVEISMPELNSLDVSSGADVDAQDIEADQFDVEVSSGGSADVAGTCGRISADVSSGGGLDARELKCRTAFVDVSSGGRARVFAEQSVTADASSGGSATIYGEPETSDIDKSSGGSVSIK